MGDYVVMPLHLSDEGAMAVIEYGKTIPDPNPQPQEEAAVAGKPAAAELVEPASPIGTLSTASDQAREQRAANANIKKLKRVAAA